MEVIRRNAEYRIGVFDGVIGDFHSAVLAVFRWEKGNCH
jgi:hypothetical protein